VSYNREAVRPLVGTIWAWEPRKPRVAALVEVTRVWWNGEEWWVKARIIAGSEFAGKPGSEWGNELNRFWEACHRVSVDHGPAGYHPAAFRRGPPQAGEGPA